MDPERARALLTREKKRVQRSLAALEEHEGADELATVVQHPADVAVVVEAVVDPDVPPLPPHISFEQAASMTKALLKGDPDATGVVRQSVLELTASVAPHH